MTTMTTTRRIPDDTAWRAVLERNPEFDDRFVFGVRTTGVYCRPSCPARRPNRENVTFFRSGPAARAAGLRGCLRCRPDEPAVDRIAAARELLESADETRLGLNELAERVGMSPGHLQRRFKARFGLSPRQLQNARRATRLRTGLRRADSVARAGYDAGFGSSSRLYAQASAALGMTPGRYARGGAGLEIGFAITDSACGRVLVATTARGVCAVLFGETDAGLEAALREEFPAATVAAAPATAALRRLVSRVASIIAGRTDAAGIPLDIMGSAFQEQVWRVLQGVPRGGTASYAEIARQAGRPDAVRAVAGAVARNRLAVLIPCHRVVRSDGGLGGYRWGVATKKLLLAAER